MAIIPRVREQHIAVFGESGSGKTVLVSSFFGPTQEASFKNDLWDLAALKTAQGNQLYKNYLGMRDKSTAPLPTRFANTSYEFALKLRPTDQPPKKRPFDELRLVWHDYPGEWFEQDPDTDEELRRRTGTFRTLLRSDVGILLVDGQRLLDNAGEEERYLKALLANFRQNLMRLKDDLADELPFGQFPRVWVLALSKSDLHPAWKVDDFRDLMILKVADELEWLRQTIAEMVAAPEALSIGEDYLLLSSAHFKPVTTEPDQVAIDVRQRVGLDLVLPIATLLPLQRVTLWTKQMQLPLKAIDQLAGGAEQMAGALTGVKAIAIQQMLKKLTKINKPTNVALKVMPALASGLQAAGPKLRAMNEDARAQHDHLRATLTQFKLDLDRGIEDRVMWVKK